LLHIIKLISIVVLTFALALFVIGIITLWLERGRRRIQGIMLAIAGLLVAGTYAFLGSSLSERLFGRLIIEVDLPALMATAFMYTAGVAVGGSLAAGLFLWATGRFRHRLAPMTATLLGAGALVAAIAILAAVLLSTA
jgi:hypothetical protein